MKSQQKKSLLTYAFLACFSWLAGASIALAHPYASGITNNSGTIYFILNESNSAVTVTLTNIGSGQGATLVASAPASSLPSTVGTNKGVQFFSMTQGATTYTNYSITVSKAGSGTINKISVDSNPLVNFFGPRGVSVNLNPQNKNFGRIYVGNSSAGLTITTFGGVVRSTGRGMYIINADQSDALGRGTNASAAGITFSTATSGTTYSPYRIHVGNDDTLFIADAMTNTCALWETDPDVSTATQVLAGIGLGSEPNGINTNGIIAAGANHGRISSTPLVVGSSGAANLQIYDIDTDYPGGLNHILNYNIGGGSLPSSVTPTILADTGLDTFFIIVDIAFGGTNVYTSGFRSGSDGDGYGGVKVFDSTGTTQIWDSYSASLTPGHDPFFLTQGVSVSPDGQFLATIRSDGSNCVVNLTNGIPDLSTLRTNALNGSTTARSICWDAADNFYVVSGGSDLLRVFSLGLSTVAVTSGDTTGASGNNHGTFQFSIPSTGASVTATTPLASQNHGSAIPGVFTFTRTGQTQNPLTVNFTVGGTATNGADYTFSPVVTTNITFGANQTNVMLTVNPVEDNIPRLTNTVVVTLLNGTNYSLSGQASDTVYIQNTGPQLLKVTALQAPSMYKPFSNDYGSFTITRYGDVSPGYTVTNFALSGTAAVGVDFAPPTVTVNSGDVTETVGVFPLVSTTAYTGNKTVTIGPATDLTVGPGYTATTDTVSLIIIDNAEPAATVLYTNALSDPSDSNNWTLRFASTNDPANLSPQDYDVEFGFSLANDSVGLPPNGSSTALKVTCNKNATGASAGVNLYLNGQTFTGDYAVRFNMNLVQGLSTLTSTEGAIFGIDHSGQATNWWAGDISSNTFHGPWAADGIWWWITSDPGGAGAGDYLEYTGTNNTYPNTGWARIAAVSRNAFPNAFKNVALAPATVPPYSTVGTVGVPANHYSSGQESTWSDVEMKQVKGVVTLSINKTALTVYTNTTMWTNGQIMLGYDDPFQSIGQNGAAYYSNLRVVRLGPPSITAITASGGNVNINFVSTDGDDTTASFVLQSSSVAAGPYADVNPAAVITQPGPTFHTSAPQSGSSQFYRIRHK